MAETCDPSGPGVTYVVESRRAELAAETGDVGVRLARAVSSLTGIGRRVRLVGSTGER